MTFASLYLFMLFVVVKFPFDIFNGLNDGGPQQQNY